MGSHLASFSTFGPSLDQSVARHVGRDLSKISTPFLICSTIADLDLWKMSSSCAVQMKGRPGFRRSRYGFMWSAEAKAYATWLTRPNQLRTSVRLRGMGNASIDCTIFGHGLTAVGVISKPANSTASRAKQNFDGF